MTNKYDNMPLGYLLDSVIAELFANLDFSFNDGDLHNINSLRFDNPISYAIV